MSATTAWLMLGLAAALIGAMALAWSQGLRQGRRLAQLEAAGRRAELQRELAAWGRLSDGDCCWRCDAQGRLLACSGPAALLPDDWQGLRLTDWLHARELPSLAERLADLGSLRGLPVLPKAPASAQTPGAGDAGGAGDGGWQLWATALHDETGQRVGSMGLLRLARAAQPASQGAGDDALSFSYTVSHDLRAPLRVVEGFARILKEDYAGQLDRVGNDHLDRVLGAAARMNQMIDALLAIARLASQPLARQPVDLSQMAHFVIDELRRTAPERQIAVNIEPGLLVQGDATLLRQVLENLLGNAWKYTQRVGEPVVTFAREVDGGTPCFVVRDNGAGFDMRGAERLFGLFQRLHSASEFPGTGVGLASVKRIIARHHGRIWAHSEPGRGAAFCFTLWD